MTRDEWLTSGDPTRMLRLLRRGRVSRRVQPLFVCACIRAVLREPVDGAVDAAIAAAERSADRRVVMTAAAYESEQLAAEEDAGHSTDIARWYVRQAAAHLVSAD